MNEDEDHLPSRTKYVRDWYDVAQMTNYSHCVEFDVTQEGLPLRY
jgi:hypothetical protein